MNTVKKNFGRPLLFLLAVFMLSVLWSEAKDEATSIHNNQMSVSVAPQGGFYEIASAASEKLVLKAVVAAKIDHYWVKSSDYPHSESTQSAFSNQLGKGQQLVTTYTGLVGKPSLVCVLRLYDEPPVGDIEVRVQNSTAKPVSVQAIRVVDAIGSPRIDLGGPEGAERVMSGGYDEGQCPISDLGEKNPYEYYIPTAERNGDAYIGVNQQLIYNRQSRQSLFFGFLTTRLWSNLLSLGISRTTSGEVHVASYTVDSNGTTEILKFGGLKDAAPEDQIELSLPVSSGKELASELVLFATGPDYHAQLDAYSEAVRVLKHARVTSKASRGWWSWTAYYGGITDGLALTNAQWLAEHLKRFGYDYFFIDEGYEYARGEYTTTNANQFPEGMRPLARRVSNLGLTLGMWTSPFQVSTRSWVYEHHKDWLVHNAAGKPIQITPRVDEPLYALDTTHPGAQEYLLQTYRTMAREWGVRFIKLDFMDTATIEGYHYQPNTTAMQAQRIGLELIRKAVGEEVLLDKDGSPMLNPVGIVDVGRISEDAAAFFPTSKAVANGFAQRYYMNRNFFVADPDAFNISDQLSRRPDLSAAPGPTPDEAEVAIVLSALVGGMFEIGDDLTLLGREPGRLALLENRDLLQMVDLSRAAVPVDLMDYSKEDEEASIFVLHEDRRQTMLAVFNWTDAPRSHSLRLDALQLPPGDDFAATDVLHWDRRVTVKNGVLELVGQPAHSVRLIKLVDTAVPPAPPSITINVPSSAEAGKPVRMSVSAGVNGIPALAYRWQFGDGTSAVGAEVTHTYTLAGIYSIQLRVEGMDGIPAGGAASLRVTGVVDVNLYTKENRRYLDSDAP
jgi:hypothetical protein